VALVGKKNVMSSGDGSVIGSKQNLTAGLCVCILDRKVIEVTSEKV